MINKQSNMTVSIEQDLQRLALFFANLRSAEIKKTNGTDFSNFFTTKLPLRGNFFRYDTNNTDEMNSNPMEKLALQDAISLIGYMYHNAENILKNSKSLLNQIITTAKEGLSTSWEEIRKTTPGTVENDLWQMEKQIPESEIITEKVKSGQLKSVDISYFSLDLSKPLFQKLVISSTGIRRGIEYFFNKNFTDKFTEEEQGCFALFLAYKIFRYGNEKCLAYFGEQQPELITKIFNDYPHLFFRREAINTCIKNEDDRQKALDAIKLTSSDKFFIGCFDKVFSKIDVVVDLRVAEEFKPVPAPEVVLDLLTLPLNMDENYDVLPIGIVEDNTTKL